VPAEPRQERLFMMRHFACSLLLLLVLSPGCSAPPDDPGGSDGGGGDCSCKAGERRCQGKGVQICEPVSASCASWGPAVDCPQGACTDGKCPGSCEDRCTAGASRCAGEEAREICRVGGSGCLEWVRDPCASGRYCAEGQCVDAIPCDGTCPAGYTCQRNGVCAGGDPTTVKLDVKTVRLSGSIQVNGAAPLVDSSLCSATRNPSYFKARITFTDSAKGYSFTSNLYCRDGDFAFATTIFPGTYVVRVLGFDDGASKPLSNLPLSSYLAESAFTISADVSGKVLNVKTVRFGGSIQVNGAAPVVDSSLCSATRNPSYFKARVTFTDSAKGYSFTHNLYCRDSAFSVDTTLFPGTYVVRVLGFDDGASKPLSNLPLSSYLAESAFTVSADVSGKVLSVKTVRFGGSITVNGAAPVVDSSLCSATRNPSYFKARVTFTDSTRGYSFTHNLYCRDGAFSVDTTLFPGTYVVRVLGFDDGASKPLSNLPLSSYLAESAFTVSADVSGKVLDVKTVRFNGSIQVNGAAPLVDSGACSATRNPSYFKARVTFTDSAKGYSFTHNLYCLDSAFTVDTTLFPGTYVVRVLGFDDGVGKPLSNLPLASYLAESALPVSTDVNGKVLDVKTVRFGGSITVNGAAPVVDSSLCSATRNPSYFKARVTFTDGTRGYSFTHNLYCRDGAFTVDAMLFPGIYVVRVLGFDDGVGKSLSNLPLASYLAESALTISADVSGKVLDVKTVTFGGSITVNGAAPVVDSSLCSATRNPSYFKARVTLDEPARGYQFTHNLYCRDADFSFRTTIFPGTYRVSVTGFDDGASKPLSNLPLSAYRAIERLQVP
jgi:hypothetical protein